MRIVTFASSGRCFADSTKGGVCLRSSWNSLSPAGRNARKVASARVEVCLQAADNFRTLRRKGVTIRRTIDTIIATCCIRNGYVLLHNDRDFDAFAEHLGLRVAVPSFNRQ